MKRAWVAALAGFVFALGLGLGGMTRPEKVIGFLDVAGHWDSSLVFVMAGAIGVHMPVALWHRRRLQTAAPDCGVGVPAPKLWDGALVAGAAVFGVGWALAGFCPGPAFVSAGGGATSALVFVVGMAVGMTVLHRWQNARALRSAATVPGGAD